MFCKWQGRAVEGVGGCLRFSYGEEGTTEFYIKEKG